MTTIYLCVSTAMFGFLVFIWSSRTWLNIFIKFGFLSMFISGLVLALQSFGFIVKV